MSQSAHSSVTWLNYIYSIILAVIVACFLACHPVNPDDCQIDLGDKVAVATDMSSKSNPDITTIIEYNRLINLGENLWYDKQLKCDCTFLDTPNDQKRCLPVNKIVSKYSASPNCNNSMINTSESLHPLKPLDAMYGFSTEWCGFDESNNKYISFIPVAQNVWYLDKDARCINTIKYSPDSSSIIELKMIDFQEEKR